ncbi:MAG TPA: hypothetical protein VGE98_13700 [Thermoanaerobaculia bacterium]
MDLTTVLEILGGVAAVALIVGSAVLVVAYRKLRRLPLRRDADFFTTIRAVPLSLVIGLDLLDLALDVLSSPIIWLLLNRLGLKALRDVATIEALIPISNVIPTLTIAWFAARWFNLGRPHDPDVLEAEPVGPNEYAVRQPQR